jgi:hypothetical protein
MRFIVTVVLCLVALYAADAYWFNGMYFNAAHSVAAQIITQIMAHF